MSSSASSLRDIRSRIDQLDRTIVELLAERQSAVDEIAAIKEQKNNDVRDRDRESQLMDRLRGIARDHDVSPELVEDLFGSIIAHSVDRQNDLRNDARPSRLRRVG